MVYCGKYIHRDTRYTYIFICYSANTGIYVTMQYIHYSNPYALKDYTLKIRGARIQIVQGRPFRMYGPCN